MPSRTDNEIAELKARVEALEAKLFRMGNAIDNAHNRDLTKWYPNGKPKEPTPNDWNRVLVTGLQVMP